MASKPNLELETRFRVLYIRVSTEAQAEEGYSIGVQKEQLEAYCRAMGWKNYQLYIDPGFSGSNLKRPKMQLERVKQGYWMGGGGIPYGYD